MPCPCILPSFHCPTYLLSVRHVYVPKPWIRPNCTCMTIGRVWPPTAGMADAQGQAGAGLFARSDAPRVLHRMLRFWAALRRVGECGVHARRRCTLHFAPSSSRLRAAGLRS